jgi:hypothetical protein
MLIFEQMTIKIEAAWTFKFNEDQLIDSGVFRSADGNMHVESFPFLRYVIHKLFF